MPRYNIVFGEESVEIELPEGTECLSTRKPEAIANPRQAILDALGNPIGSPRLEEIVKTKSVGASCLKVAIVVSDNTRPVPYTGDAGILSPTIDLLLECGVRAENITIIVATGTHRSLSEAELRKMFDRSVFERSINIICHDCRDESNLKFVGTTSRGTDLFVNRLYLEADVKILTGLVESHFMAGASGGRKAVCPGLAGEKSTFVFHGPEFLSSPRARDLSLEGNPCHEDALEAARMAGADFIVNVTIDSMFQLTGIYAGDLESAHLEAVNRIAEYVSIPLDREYDIVVTHAGFVGINHYQAAKAGVVAVPALKPTGKLVMAANATDVDPVGGPLYRTVLHLLSLYGAERFNQLLLSPDWSFIPEQWQVQMWARVFSKIPMDNFTYCFPHISPRDGAILPGKDGNSLLPSEQRYSRDTGSIATMVELAVDDCMREYEKQGIVPSIAFLEDGPYGVLVHR